MELRHIRYFKAVAEELNFTRAAEKLNIAQPPLSRQIQDLEQDLGTKLFIRNPHKILLTREGELFLQYANQILLFKRNIPMFNTTSGTEIPMMSMHVFPKVCVKLP